MPGGISCGKPSARAFSWDADTVASNKIDRRQYLRSGLRQQESRWIPENQKYPCVDIAEGPQDWGYGLRHEVVAVHAAPTLLVLRKSAAG